MNKKLKEFLLVTGTHVGLGLLTAILFYILAAYVVGPIACNRVGDIVVPDVVGVTQDEARALLADKGLTVEVEAAKVDSNYPDGFVAEQNPVAGLRVKPGKAVRLSLSAGISELHMPNFVAYKKEATPTPTSYTPLEKARTILNRMGLALENIESRFDTNIPKDCVIDQTPAPNVSVKRGTKVTLLVSKGPEEANVILPNFIGSTPAEAGKQLKELGLDVGNVVAVPRADMPAGRIINQFPPVGTMMKRGEKVNFEVSKSVGGMSTPEGLPKPGPKTTPPKP